MAVLAVLLGIAALIFLSLWLLSRRNLKNAVAELRRIRGGQTGRRLRLSSPDRQMEELIAEVNLLLEDSQRSELAHKKAEQQHRDEIANISHDLRTPLTSVIGYLQLMEQPACTPEERKEYLAVCESRARSLQDLLAGFYDLSRLEAGGYPLELEPVDPAGVLFQLAADYYMDLTDAGMEPVLEIPETLPPVCADRPALRRVFENLLQNAIKHGGERLVITSGREGDFLCIRFRNAAPGLSEEDCARLFDRFFTADRMRTGKGTGLGLAIVRALCRRMGGEASARLSGEELVIEVRLKLMPGARQPLPRP